MADKFILLMAGKDCPPPPEFEECGPCIGSVAILMQDPETGASKLVASDRVYASASLESRCITQFDLSPQADCRGQNCPPPFKGNTTNSYEGEG